MKKKRFIIVRILFIVLLMAVTAVALNYRFTLQSRMTSTAAALNRRATLQSRMAANQTQAVKTSLGQMMTLERAIWELTRDPCWRTGASVYSSDGCDSAVTVSDSALSGYSDAVFVSVTAPGAASGITTAFRYYLTDFPERAAPRQNCRDSRKNRDIVSKDTSTMLKKDGITGAMTRGAGNGRSGSSGDGGPATRARITKPNCVFLDSAGNLFIASENHVIRVVSHLDQKIRTLAGTGTPGFNGGDKPAVEAQLDSPSGVALNPTRGGRKIYISDRDNHRVRMLTLKIEKRLY